MGGDSKTKAGFGCLVVFLLPFCAVGVFTGGMAIWKLLQGTADWQEIAFLGVFSLAFGGAGFGILFAALTAQNKQKERRIGTQSGGSSGTPFYDLYLVRRSGRDVLIGRFIRNKREAEWLAGEVKACLGTCQS
jgi:hypothetical protein